MENFKEYCEQDWKYDGMSAKFIYGFAKKNKQEYAYPHDPDDLCRCIQVLRLLFGEDEYAKKYFLKTIGMIENSKQHKLLGDNWFELMLVFRSEWKQREAPNTYEFMQRINEGTLSNRL